MRPTLRQLEYAIAVAEYRHFRRAAESCHVTQPALSTQIRQLEELLGVQIFERDRRAVHVTAAGEQIMVRARACTGEMRELEDLAARLASPGTGPLRLGVIPTVAPYLLPALLPLLHETHPGYELEIWEEQTSSLIERLDHGEVDLLLLAFPLPGDDRDGHELIREPFMLLLPEGHRLSTIEEPGDEDLAGEPVLLLEDGHCLRDHALAACRLGTGALSGPVHANSLSMLVQMVRNGLGITLLPASAVPVEVTDRNGLVVRRFRDPAPSRILGTLWRNASARAPDFVSLSQLFASNLQSQMDRALQSL